MENEEMVEKLVNFTAPFAFAGAIFLDTFLGLVFVMDKYIFNLDLGTLELRVKIFGVLFILTGFLFYYSKAKLKYFAERKNFLTHLFLFIFIPICIGAYLSYGSYSAKMKTFGDRSKNEVVKKQ